MSLAGRIRASVPYEILSSVGAGGMGEVYRARDPRLGRDVAIKVLPAASPTTPTPARFEQEARAAGALNHPNILAIYDVGTHEGAPYLVSELLEGETLRARARRAAAARAQGRSTTRSRSPAAWPPRTTRASSIATSSPRTSSSPATAASRSSTSASPS